MQLDILAIGVHPDDVELACAGTLLHHIALGHKVGILDLTRGELGTRGSAELRTQEAAASAQLMGASVRENLDLADGFFENNMASVLAIVQQIRRFRPRIVLANAIKDRHPDHGRAAQLISDACFYAGLRKIETTWQGEAQTAHRPENVYHYIQDYNLQADFVFDISAYMDKKLELILCFGSQFFDPNSQEPRTPISGPDFLEFVRAKARTYGRPAGFDYAEAYTVARNIGVHNLFDLS
jgi:N-acetylglucosamine malate deacetylase 1